MFSAVYKISPQHFKKKTYEFSRKKKKLTTTNESQKRIMKVISSQSKRFLMWLQTRLGKCCLYSSIVQCSIKKKKQF